MQMKQSVFVVHRLVPNNEFRSSSLNSFKTFNVRQEMGMPERRAVLKFGSNEG